MLFHGWILFGFLSQSWKLRPWPSLCCLGFSLASLSLVLVIEQWALSIIVVPLESCSDMFCALLGHLTRYFSFTIWLKNTWSNWIIKNWNPNNLNVFRLNRVKVCRLCLMQLRSHCLQAEQPLQSPFYMYTEINSQGRNIPLTEF